MAYRVYNFTAASGATGTNKQYVGPHRTLFFVLSTPTAFQAAAGNSTYQIRGGLSTATAETHATILSNTVATETVKGVYQMPYPGTPWISVGFGTAICGTASNSVDVVVYSDDQ